MLGEGWGLGGAGGLNLFDEFLTLCTRRSQRDGVLGSQTCHGSNGKRLDLSCQPFGEHEERKSVEAC